MQRRNSNSYCILCGSPSPERTTSPEGFCTVLKFLQQIQNFASSFSHHAGLRGLSPAHFCDRCLCDMTLSTENGEEVTQVEAQVRKLQQELVKLLHQLWKLVGNYLEGMKKMEESVKNVKGSQDWTKENVALFHSAIIQVVETLNSFRGTLSTKLLLPKHPEAVAEEEFLVDIKLGLPVDVEHDPLLCDDDIMDHSDPASPPPPPPPTSDSKDSRYSFRRKAAAPPVKDLESEEDEEDDPDYVKSEPPSSPEESENESMDFTIEPCERDTSPPPVRKKRKSKSLTSTSSTKPSKSASSQSLKKKANPGTCEVCGSSVIYLNRHMKRAHNITKSRNPFRKVRPEATCDLCHAKMTKAELVAHLQEHVGLEYVIRCPYEAGCPFACATPERIRTHLEKSSVCRAKGGVDFDTFRQNQRTCQECQQVFPNLLNLRGHITRFHETAEKPFLCPISECGQRFTLRHSVVLHLAHHDLPRQVDSQSCTQCQETLNLPEMEAHLKERHDVTEIIKCPNCPFLFGVREHLVEHLHEHRFSTSLRCDICLDSAGVFNRHGPLVEHYFKEHQIGRQWPCDQCGRVYWTKWSLQSHQKVKHSSTPPTYASQEKKTISCEECGHTVGSKVALRSHQIRFHGAAPFGCSFCSETFCYLQKLQDHEKEVHKGVQTQYPCTEPGCGEVFSKSYLLGYHRSHVHAKEGTVKTYVCHECGKEYQTRGGLASHRKAVHLNIRNHVCEDCGEAFTAKTVMQKHRLIHTGERPFACEICGQKFRTKEVMQRHIVGHESKGAQFRPNGSMKQVRKRVDKK